MNKGRLNSQYKHGHASKKAGNTPHPLYATWCSIIERCYNPNAKRYADYGGRGINMCVAWRRDFVQFITDIGERPKNTSLDRIDNDKGYYQDNVRWASITEQATNKRNNRRISWGGVELCMSEWSKVLELDFDAIRARMDASGSFYPPQPEVYRTRQKGNRLEIYTTQKKRYVGSVPLGAEEWEILELLRVSGGV